VTQNRGTAFFSIKLLKQKSMKNSKRLLNCILIIALSCFIQLVKAQIVYTDVNPDSTFNTDGGTYNLDLNNDGTVDFLITFSVFWGCNGFSSIKVVITPTDNNAVANDITYPAELIAGAMIDSNSSFNGGGDQIMAQQLWHIVFINWYFHQCLPSITGEWEWLAYDKYLGLRIKVGMQKFYGWARLDVDGGFTVKDYAYNTIPDSSILAGEMGIPLAVLTPLSENNFSVFPNPFSTSTTISFSLSQSENVSLKIFDAEGRLVRTLANESMSAVAHTRTWDACDENGNAVSAGIYFLRMETASEVKTISVSVVK